MLSIKTILITYYLIKILSDTDVNTVVYYMQEAYKKYLLLRY